MHSTFTTAVCATVAALALASPATAQSPCGDSYRIDSGDTLYSISQRCRVSLARIMDLNPSLGDPRDISVGTKLRLAAGNPHGDDRDAPPSRTGDGDGYRVKSGDTMFSIARTLGVSLIELLNANRDVDPLELVVGELLDIPGNTPAATVRVRPRSGPPGSDVTVRARGLRPRDWVTVGAGRRASEWRELDSFRVAADGELRAEVTVPRWADPGDDLIFVVDTDRGVTFKSAAFDVTSGKDGGGDQMVLRGRVRSGTECYTLRTPDGDTWSLVSDDVEFTAGEYVEVEGRRADMSICMAGVGTLDVEQIREIEPPARDRDPDRSGGVRLDGEYLRGDWAAKGGDCGRPDFAITANSAGGLVVETSLAGSPRTGYVALGPDPAFVFDQPHREFELESRGPDGVAVMPPSDGPIALGGRRISGDGRVFVKCR